MLSDALSHLSDPDSEAASILWTKISKLKTQKLHTIRWSKKIQAVCKMVIWAIENIYLIPVDESEIIERKLKKEKYRPIDISDDARWKNGTKIRSDWITENWKNKLIHGWSWENYDGTMLGVIYQVAGSNPQICIDRNIATNPGWALVLIRAMKKKLEQVSFPNP
jgi:predicted P-loop ATPase